MPACCCCDTGGRIYFGRKRDSRAPKQTGQRWRWTAGVNCERLAGEISTRGIIFKNITLHFVAGLVIKFSKFKTSYTQLSWPAGRLKYSAASSAQAKGAARYLISGRRSEVSRGRLKANVLSWRLPAAIENTCARSNQAYNLFHVQCNCVVVIYCNLAERIKLSAARSTFTFGPAPEAAGEGCCCALIIGVIISILGRSRSH